MHSFKTQKWIQWILQSTCNYCQMWHGDFVTSINACCFHVSSRLVLFYIDITNRDNTVKRSNCVYLYLESHLICACVCVCVCYGWGEKKLVSIFIHSDYTDFLYIWCMRTNWCQISVNLLPSSKTLAPPIN